MDEIVPRRQAGAGLGVADERGDRNQPRDPGVTGARDDLLAIGVELLKRQVRVAVAEHRPVRSTRGPS